MAAIVEALIDAIDPPIEDAGVAQPSLQGAPEVWAEGVGVLRHHLVGELIAQFQRSQHELGGLLGVPALHAFASVEHRRQIVEAQGVAHVGGSSVEGDGGGEALLDALAVLVQIAEVDHAGGVAEIGRPLAPVCGLGGVDLHADALVVHHGEVHHRRRVSGLAGLGQEVHRLRDVLVDDLAVDEDHAQAVHRVQVVPVGGGLEQAHALLRVPARAAPLDQADAEHRRGVEIAGRRAHAKPADGLGVVARHADPARVHPAQAMHDGGIAGLAQPAQRAQEIAIVGRNAPDLEDRFGAGHRRRHPLAQLVHGVDGAAIEADDDIAEANARHAGGASGRGLHDQCAIGVAEPERQGERQLERIGADAEPTLLSSGRHAADLHRQLDDAPERLGGLDRRRLGWWSRVLRVAAGPAQECCGEAGVKTGGCAPARGGCVGMRTMSMPVPAMATTNEVSGRE